MWIFGYPYPPASGPVFKATLYTDAPDTEDAIDLRPHDLLESVQFQASVGEGVRIVQASGTTLLQPRTLYWLALEPVETNGIWSSGAWSWNDQNRRGNRSHYDLPPLYGDWTTYPNSVMPAFRITVNPVPVPGVAWLIAGAFGWLCWSAWTRA
jgi:hypothetical protein